jgi:DNA-directed RNA polymerase beta subunit
MDSTTDTYRCIETLIREEHEEFVNSIEDALISMNNQAQVYGSKEEEEKETERRAKWGIVCQISREQLNNLFYNFTKIFWEIADLVLETPTSLKEFIEAYVDKRYPDHEKPLQLFGRDDIVTILTEYACARELPTEDDIDVMRGCLGRDMLYSQDAVDSFDYLFNHQLPATVAKLPPIIEIEKEMKPRETYEKVMNGQLTLEEACKTHRIKYDANKPSSSRLALRIVADQWSADLEHGPREHKIRFLGVKYGPAHALGDFSCSPITPKNCVLMGETYVFTISLDVEYTVRDVETGKIVHLERGEFRLVRCPCLTRSKFCNLNGLSREELIAAGEDPDHKVSCYIIGGLKKIHVHMERIAVNAIYVWCKYSRRVSGTKQIASFVRSSLEKDIEGGSGSLIHMYKPPPGKLFTYHGPFSGFDIISVILPQIDEELPLYLVLAAIGVEGVENAEKLIISPLGTDTTWGRKALVTLRESWMEIPGGIWPSKEEALSMLERSMAAGMADNPLTTRCGIAPWQGGSRRDKLNHLLQNIWLCHISGMVAKVNHVCEQVRQVLCVYHGRYQGEEMNYWGSKRIITTGSLMHTEMKKFTNKNLATLKHKIKNLLSHKQPISLQSLSNLVDFTAEYIKHVSGNGFIRRIGRSSNDSASRDGAQQTGICQAWEATNMMASVAQCRKIDVMMEKNTPNQQPRQLNPDSWGFICKDDTPDGNNVGFVKNFAQTVMLSMGREDVNVRAAVRQIGLMPLNMDGGGTDRFCSLVMVNGDPMGWTRDAFEFYQSMRKFRSGGYGFHDIGIHPQILPRNDIQLPHKNMKRGHKFSRIYLNKSFTEDTLAETRNKNEEEEEEEEQEQELFFGSRKEKEAHQKRIAKPSPPPGVWDYGNIKHTNSPLVTIVDDCQLYIPQIAIWTDAGRTTRPLFPLEMDSQRLPMNHWDYRRLERYRHVAWSELIQRGVVELLDARECEVALIATHPHMLQNPFFTKMHKAYRGYPLYDHYTHSEITPASIIGLCISMIPGVEHNHGARNTFNCAMVKQHITAPPVPYCPGEDKHIYHLVYPQTPLYIGESGRYLSWNALTTQIGLVAVLPSDNSEDAIKFNRDAIEAGFGRVLEQTTYSVSAISDPSAHREIGIPDFSNSSDMKYADYSCLDTDGCALPGSRVANLFDQQSVLVGVKETRLGQDVRSSFADGHRRSRNNSDDDDDDGNSDGNGDGDTDRKKEGGGKKSGTLLDEKFLPKQSRRVAEKHHPKKPVQKKQGISGFIPSSTDPASRQEALSLDKLQTSEFARYLSGMDTVDDAADPREILKRGAYIPARVEAVPKSKYVSGSAPDTQKRDLANFAQYYDIENPDEGGKKPKSVRFSNCPDKKHPLPSSSSQANKKRLASVDRSVMMRTYETGTVSKVLRYRSGQRDSTRVVISNLHELEIGDKTTTIAAQKSVITLMERTEDFPFCPQLGCSPIAIINPLCLPSRMTVGQPIETLCSLAAVIEGVQYVRPQYGLDRYEERARRVLKEHGLHPQGLFELYDGITGELMDANIAMGFLSLPILRHFVGSKFQACGGSGAKNRITHQVMRGRQKQGATRFGEMEKDTLTAHGAAFQHYERLNILSNPDETTFCRHCGKEAICRRHEYPFVYCQSCKDNKSDFDTVPITHTTKVLIRELQTAGVILRVETTPASEETGAEKARVAGLTPRVSRYSSVGSCLQDSDYAPNVQFPDLAAKFEERKKRERSAALAPSSGSSAMSSSSNTLARKNHSRSSSRGKRTFSEMVRPTRGTSGDLQSTRTTTTTAVREGRGVDSCRPLSASDFAAPFAPSAPSALHTSSAQTRNTMSLSLAPVTSTPVPISTIAHVASPDVVDDDADMWS